MKQGDFGERSRDRERVGNGLRRGSFQPNIPVGSRGERGPREAVRLGHLGPAAPCPIEPWKRRFGLLPLRTMSGLCAM